MTGSKEIWLKPQIPLVLTNDQVHLWRISAKMPSKKQETLYSVLTKDEIQQADRFRFSRDRRRFIVRRAVLRILLGHYLDVTPPSIRFDYNEYGKPRLGNKFTNDTLKFNISHSQDLVLMAFTRKRKIGVDIEYIDPSQAKEQIVDLFFATGEKAVLKKLKGRARVEGFFHCWTRKESYIKAIGQGLSKPLDNFEVSLHPDKPPALLGCYGSGETIWCFKDIHCIDNYSACLVVEGNDWQLQFYCWDYTLK